ncbi:LysR substrate-binding domain-containing protein [Belnapia arida]
MALVLSATGAGRGLACVLEDQVQDEIDSGTLVRALADWCPPSQVNHFYYPHRRQPTPAFMLLVDALRHNG